MAPIPARLLGLCWEFTLQSIVLTLAVEDLYLE